MSEASCPRCGASVDPARAPVARVRASRVLTYCSAACADGHPVAETPRGGAPALPAEGATPGAAPGATPRRRGLFWTGAALAAAGAALALGGAVLSGGSGGEPEQGAADPVAPADESASDKDAPEPPERVAAARAEALLREEMESAPPSIAVLAAAALARTGDDQALAMLRERLDGDDDPTSRVDLGLALARAGDPRGRQALEEALGGGDPYVAIRAATALADASRRGVGAEPPLDPLVALLDEPAHRAGAAAALARLGDERGARELRQVLRRRRSSVDEKLRAAVALARSGDASAGQEVLAARDRGALAGDAAEALAALGDEDAVAELEASLASPGSRVPAAEALHRLGAEVDLEPLVRALLSERGAARIAAAEAILVLETPD